jgi:hypothetical protein
VGVNSGTGPERNRSNLGRRTNQVGAWVQVAFGSLITIAAAAGAALMLLYVKSPGSALAFPGFFLLLGLLLVGAGVISIRQLRRPGNVSADVSQFANADQWNVKSALPAASAAASETVVDWMGPMMMAGWGFHTSASITQSKETDHNPFNTLLLTTSQLIGILLTPEDLAGVEVGDVRKGITGLIDQWTEPTFQKNTQFEMVNRSRWDEIVTSATSPGLQPLLAHHVNFGLPYTAVESFSVSKHLINPGLVFRLRDGRKMKCAALRKEQIDHVAQSLSQYLTKV